MLAHAIGACEQQDAERGDQQQPQPILVLFAHQRHAGATRREMQHLLVPPPAVMRAHVEAVARQPLAQLALQLCLQRPRVRSRSHPPDQIEPGQARILEARRRAGDERFCRQRQPHVRHVRGGDFRSEKAGRRHADDRKRPTVDVVRRADDGRIGSVLLLPRVEADHRDRQRTPHIVGIGEQTPAPRGDPERLEEIAGHELAEPRLHRLPRAGAADGDVAVTRADLERGELLERGGVGAEALVRFPREQRPVVLRRVIALRVSGRVAARDGVADAPKLLRLRDRQRSQHDLLNQGEDRGRRADAECQRHDSSCGKAR